MHFKKVIFQARLKKMASSLDVILLLLQTKANVLSLLLLPPLIGFLSYLTLASGFRDRAKNQVAMQGKIIDGIFPGVRNKYDVFVTS